MTLIFHLHISDGIRVEAVEHGRVSFEDGALAITPASFKTWLLAQETRQGKELNPGEGKKYLQTLLRVFQGQAVRASLAKEDGHA